MVRVAMRENDVADRQLCDGPKRCPEQPPIGQAAARVDDRNAVTADDKPGIGDPIEVAGRRFGAIADPDIVARCDLGDPGSLSCRPNIRHEGQQQQKTQRDAGRHGSNRKTEPPYQAAPDQPYFFASAQA